MYLGWIFAALTGAALPAWAFLIGDMINAFGGSADDMLKKVSRIAYIQVASGAGIFLFSYLYYAFLLMSSEKIIRKTRTAYISAILK